MAWHVDGVFSMSTAENWPTSLITISPAAIDDCDSAPNMGGSRFSCSLSFLGVVLSPCYIFSDISSCLLGAANFDWFFFE